MRVQFLKMGILKVDFVSIYENIFTQIPPAFLISFLSVLWFCNKKILPTFWFSFSQQKPLLSSSSSVMTDSMHQH